MYAYDHELRKSECERYVVGSKGIRRGALKDLRALRRRYVEE